MIVVIDDERTFHPQAFGEEEILYLRTSQDALLWFAEWVAQTNFLPSGATADVTQIWFDHDLGSMSAGDGVLVAKYIALVKKYDPSFILEDASIYVHSQNPVGARNIQNIFHSLELECYIRPLPEMAIL